MNAQSGHRRGIRPARPRPGSLALAFALLALIAMEIGGGEATSVGAGVPYEGDQEALRVGRQVLAIQAALQNPESLDAMEAIMDLGTDSRYYVMLRGWLAMQLHADRSILAASDEAAPMVERRAELLERAIRAIDLE